MPAPDLYSDDFGPDQPVEDVIASRALGEPMISVRPDRPILQLVPEDHGVSGGRTTGELISISPDGYWSQDDRSREVVAAGAH